MSRDSKLSLREVRRSRGITQAGLAAALGIDQTNVSRLEGRDDVHLSTLRDYIGALGGELELRARFPNGVVQIGPRPSSPRRLTRLQPSIREWIQPLVDRLVRDFQPDRIAVFGSHARGTATPESDLDLLVILPHVENRREAAIAVRRSLNEIPVPKDILVISSEQAAQSGYGVGTIVREALEEGVTVYPA